MLEPIIPAATLADLHPPETVLAPRTTWERAKWSVIEPYRLDFVTGHTLPVMGSMPLICHRAVAAAVGLEFLSACGLPTPQNIEIFDAEEEAIALAAARIRRGERLVYAYPLPDEVSSDSSVLVPVDAYAFLNDKRNLPELAGADRVPQRRVLSFAGIRDWKGPLPAYLKVAIAGANGGGHDVRYCVDLKSWADALDAFRLRGGSEPQEVIVEEAVDIGTCWCMGVAVLDDGVRFLGGAAQTFSAPAVQKGNRIDPSDAPPGEAVEAALEIAERGRSRGYRGIAGFDMALDANGRLYVFDLNFRLNASTTALLLHDSAVKRIGATVSETWAANVEKPLAAAIDALLPFAEAGTFVPTRFYDATPQSRGMSTIGGLIIADSAAETQRLGEAFDAALRSLSA